MKMNNLEDSGEYIGAPGAITGTDLSKYYDQHGKFDSQAAIQSGEKITDVLETLFHQPYSHLTSNYERFILTDGCSVYSKPDSVNNLGYYYNPDTMGSINVVDEKKVWSVVDKLEDRVYRSAYGDVYEYNPSFGKFQLVGVSRNNARIFYTAADAEIFLKCKSEKSL